MTGVLWRIGEQPWLREQFGAPLMRVVIDNDFAGDPDNFFQLAHHLLSPSVDIRAVIASHLRAGDPLHPSAGSAEAGRRAAGRLAEVMHVDLAGELLRGCDDGLADCHTARPSPAAEAIIAEAMRDEPGLAPLFVLCGGGLTDLACAWLIEPAIASRLTVIWIGGPEYEGSAPGVARRPEPEYNLITDPVAAQVVLNDSDLPLWLVPRDVYRQCLVSQAQLRTRLSGCGALGAFLLDALERRFDSARRSGRSHGETYTLGDSPLVLLTALQSFYAPEPSSSDYVERPCPQITEQGRVTGQNAQHPIRVYQRLDTGLMVEDMFAKFEEFARWLEAASRSESADGASSS